jgi:hypothetical protein
MSVEQSVEWEFARETELLGENLPQCHTVHHKSHMTWPGLELGPPRWEAGDLPPELWRGLQLAQYMAHKRALANTAYEPSGSVKDCKFSDRKY